MDELKTSAWVKTIIVLLSILAFLTINNPLPCLSRQTVEEAEEYLQKADDAAYQGDYEQALQYIDEAIGINPKAIYFSFKGEILEELRKFDEAIQAYRDAINLDKDYLNAYLNLARLYIDLGMLDSAIETAKSALQTTYVILGNGAKMNISEILYESYSQKADKTGSEDDRTRANMYEAYFEYYKALTFPNAGNEIEAVLEEDNNIYKILTIVNVAIILMLVFYCLFLHKKVRSMTMKK